MSERIEVRVRDCACPDTPHPDGDVVYMSPTVGLELGMAAEMDMGSVADLPDNRKFTALVARWGVTYVLYGAIGWNFTDEKREPVPFDVSVLLEDYTLGKPVADKGADLYGPTVMAPFVKAAEEAQRKRRPPRSPAGQTTPSTSPSQVVPLRGRSRPSSDTSSAGPQSATAR